MLVAPSEFNNQTAPVKNSAARAVISRKHPPLGSFLSSTETPRRRGAENWIEHGVLAQHQNTKQTSSRKLQFFVRAAPARYPLHCAPTSRPIVDAISQQCQWQRCRRRVNLVCMRSFKCGKKKTACSVHLAPTRTLMEPEQNTCTCVAGIILPWHWQWLWNFSQKQGNRK